jgi:ATP-dependent DNA helicase RecG
MMIKFTAPEDRIIRHKQPDNAGVVDVVANVVEILTLIKENPEITTKELGTKLDMSERQIQRVIKKLREAHKIKRVGSDRTGY